MKTIGHAPSPWAPLRHPTFRMLWGAWLTANVCMWMHDVAAAWLMTSLTPNPVMVALVQAAASLPVFLLGVPSGALADIVDRRRYFIFTQVWAATVAVVLCLLIFAGGVGPWALLTLTFANGITLAMRWPVFAAVVPELVPREDLPGALASNGLAMNAARVVGPIVAGAVIAAAGSAYVFLLNAVLSVAVVGVLLRWRHAQKVSALPSERFFGAIRVGLQHVRQSPQMLTVLARVALFFVQSIALIALLPLVARRLEDGGAATFTLLMAFMGSGAVVAALMLPWLRQRLDRDELVRAGTLLHAAATLAAAFAPNLYLAAPALLLAGCAWISVANSLTVAAQMALPDWVRARGMAIYQMAMMGGGTLGAALWGQVANLTDVRTSLVCAALAGVVGLVLTRHLKVGSRADEDLTPAGLWQAPEVAIPLKPDQGPVVVTVEYHIDPARADEFVAVMRESRRAWLRNGLLAWELFRDISDPGRYMEQFVDESWVAYLRRNDRVSASYAALREQKRAFHLGEAPPRITRCVAEPVARA